MFRLGFPKTARLRRKTDIDPVFRDGSYHRMGWLQAKSAPGETSTSRFMISVGKRTGGAAVRNRIKRVVREAIRLNRHRVTIPHDICFFVTTRPPPGFGLADAERAVQRLFDQLAPRDDGRAEEADAPD